MRTILAAMMVALLPMAVSGNETGVLSLDTADATRGWEAVGRIDISDSAFCTGTLIAPALVLTAAHCLFDQRSGAAVDVHAFKFLAGWRNGRAVAYRGVKRAVAHPDYVYEGRDRIDRVAYDLALLELDQPIRLPSVRPFEIGSDPRRGDEVSVVSYALDRAEAPSLEETCEVLGRQPGVLVLSCSVDYGASGAPIFMMSGGVPHIVSVVSAKAEMNKARVALGTAMAQPLSELRAAFAAAERPFRSVTAGSGLPASDASGPGGAKFVRP